MNNGERPKPAYFLRMGRLLLLYTSLLTYAPSASAVLGNLVAWGDGFYVPPVVTNLIAIAAGQTQWPVGITADGTVVRWPGGTPDPVGITNVVAITLGYDHGLALRPDGRVVGFGNNWYGDIIVPPDLTNAVAVSAGYENSLALRSDNTVLAWGYNFWGQTNVPPGLSNVIAVASGPYHSLALKGDGTVVAWGYNDTQTTVVPAGLRNVVAIAAGERFSLALRDDGTVVPWGSADLGRTAVPDGTSNVVAIAAGELHGLALKSDGTVIAWGYTNAGQTSVPPGLTNVVAIAAGGYKSLALTNDGSPAITWQPRSQKVYSGSTCKLTVGKVGTPPLSYQWRLNNQNIGGATNSSLTVTNFGPADSGDYTVVIANNIGTTISTPAKYEMVVAGPYLNQSPTNVTTLLQSTVTFAVRAEGSQPMTYRWQFNGTDIPGATNADLVLTNVQVTSAGTYRVFVVNPVDTAVSSDAVLSVMPILLAPVPHLTPYGIMLVLTGCPANAQTITLYSSTNLTQWQIAATRDATYSMPDTSYVLYDPSTNAPFRFYRVGIE